MLMSMAVKTSPLDSEAYEALARRRRPGQSFSDLGKERCGGRATVADFKRIAADLKLSEATLDAIEEQIRARGESPAHAADE
jgi:predicted CopG family antitoxin